MSVSEAYAYCRAITHEHGANFSVGFRFLPERKRLAVYAAYAACRVADDLADEDDVAYLLNVAPGLLPHEDAGPPSPATRLARLDAWHHEIDACYAGNPSHPVTIALADALQHFAIPKRAFIELIDGCRQDLVKTRYETFEELLHYCDLVAATISDISLAIFGYRSDAALGHGRKLSTALQLTNVTRDVGDDLQRDRIYLPQEELLRFAVSERDLELVATGGAEKPVNDRVRRLLEFQIARAEQYFREAEPLLKELSFDARFPTLLMGGVYATVLGKLRKDPLTAVRKRLRLSAFQKVMVVGTRVLRPHFV